MKIMLDVFMEKIQDYPHLNNNQLPNLKDIFMQGEKIYILDEQPPIDIMKLFPNFTGEFSLLLINNIWFLTVSNKKSAYIPIELEGYVANGSAQFFAHSHPNDGTTANLFPSFSDLMYSDAIDHKFYIISAYGITEVDVTNARKLNYLDEMFRNYIWDNHISNEEYQQNQFQVYMNFMESLGCKLNVISFDNKNEITEIINSKKLLHTEFWSRKAETTPYPGRKL